MTSERGTTASICRYVRFEVFPTPFCAGCGHGILLGAILRAIDGLGWNIEEMLFVSGIGCGGWIPSPHFAADTLHTTHGRPVAFATGAKLFNPQLRVVVIGGDGDLASIGGNHLIHAARRDTDLTVICANNGVYGMTGGQVTPTTPLGAGTATTPTGNPDRPFDLCRLVEAAGATYVARYSVYQVRPLIRSLKRALEHRGFAFVEVLSTCPTQYGRRNDLADPVAMLRDLKARCVTLGVVQKQLRSLARILALKSTKLFLDRSLGRAARMGPEELKEKIVVGEFVGG